MGCSSSKATDALKPPDMGLSSMKSQIITRIFNSASIKEMSKKAFVSMLNKYPDSKQVFRVPETTNTKADVVDTKEVKAASDKFLDHYVDIAKTADSNFDQTIRRKAEELNKQGVKADYIKCYGENLVQNITKDTQNKLTTEEENACKLITNKITNGLTTEMNKLPKSSSATS